MGCIYISHLLDEVLACTQRIVVLKDGKKVGNPQYQRGESEQDHRTHGRSET
jgi:ABC-type sugar transport system ATPase subunit